MNFKGAAILSAKPLAYITAMLSAISAKDGAPSFLRDFSKLSESLSSGGVPIEGVVGYSGSRLDLVVDIPVRLEWTPFEEQGGNLALSITSVSVGFTGIGSPGARPRITIGLVGNVKFSGVEFPFGVEFSEGAARCRISAEVGTAPVGGWMAALGIDLKSTFLSDAGTPELLRFELVLPLSASGGRPNVEVSLGWSEYHFTGGQQYPSVCLLRPRVDFSSDFSAAGSKVGGSGRIRIKDHGEFDVAVRLPSGSFVAEMAAGSAIDLKVAFGGVLGRLMGTDSTLELVVLDLEGDLSNMSFSFSAATAGELVFKLAEKYVAISDIDFSVGNSSGSWLGSLSAAVSIGPIRVEAAVVLQRGTCDFTCFVPYAPVKDISESLLGMKVPDSLLNVCLTNSSVAFSIGDANRLEIKAAATGDMDLGSLRVGFEHFSVKYELSALSMDGRATLRLPGNGTANEGPTVLLGFSYAAGKGILEGSGSNLGLRLADLVDSLTEGLGLTQPLQGGPAIVDAIDVQVDFDGETQRLGLHCSVIADPNNKDASETKLFFVAQRKSGGAWRSYFTVSLPGLDLANLPLVGSVLRAARGSGGTAEADKGPRVEGIAFGFASKSTGKELEQMLKGLNFGSKMPALDLSRGYGAKADIVLPNGRRSVEFPRAAASTQTPHLPAPKETVKEGGAPKSAESASAATLEKAQPSDSPAASADDAPPAAAAGTFGFVTIERVDASADDNGLSLSIDATGKLGPITLSFMELTAKAPVEWPPRPDFSLKGVAVTCTTDTFSLAGALVVSKGEYAGSIAARFGKFSLTAYGSYVDATAPSISVYAVLDAPLGGPPAFFINGLAGGVGINRALPAATIESVGTHVFVEAATGTGGAATLQKFREEIKPEAGQQWVAFGVRFSSFNMVDSFALLTLSQGSETRVNLLGRSFLQFPPATKSTANVPTLVQMELVLLADFRPDAGEFKLLGQLTQRSFLFHRDARLTGGFAFCFWFGDNLNAGDFVLSVGGYHPDFRVPSHYPVVPPIGLNWQVTSQLSIKGSQYFAVTPAYAMMGGSLSIAWQSGSIRAWLDFQAHFLIRFQPFRFGASIMVNVGVEATIDAWLTTIRISVTVGARLRVWGPPFGGVSEVTAAGITFRIEFGEPEQTGPAIVDWSTVRQTLLPAANADERKVLAGDSSVAATFGRTPNVTTHTDSLIGLSVESGLIDTQGAEGSKKTWVVSPGDLVIGISALVPFVSSKLENAGGGGGAEQRVSRVGIRPMGKGRDAFKSTLAVSITHASGNLDRWTITTRESRVPAALWGDPGDTTSINITDVPTGIALAPERITGKSVAKRPSWTQGEDTLIDANGSFWVKPAKTIVKDVVSDSAMIARTVSDAVVAQRRQRILDIVSELSRDGGESHNMLTRQGRTPVKPEVLTTASGLSEFGGNLANFLIAAPFIVEPDSPSDARVRPDAGESQGGH
ncbi:DUF6603 domain-containing protein [Paraburkholderia phytofirmans]|uniref:DUF6603 domain-containing protein n=1 Tax=Paraburkholderia phytofirmans TaxID=261302 RepID=UPI0038BDD798